MADVLLTERTPLARTAVASRVGRPGPSPGVELREITGRTSTLLIARADKVAEAVRLAAGAGVTLPRAPKVWSGPGCSVVWAGPEQWLVVAEPHGQSQADRLIAACAPSCMVVDQSDARALIAIGGPQAREALAKGFPVDLHPRVFGPGDTAITIAGGITAQLWQVDAAPRYEIAVARSFAESFWHWLLDAAAEFGCVVEG